MILWIIFSGKRAGRPRKILLAQSKRARSARKMILWIIFSEGGPKGPGSRRPRTYPPANYGLAACIRESRPPFLPCKTALFPV